MKSSVAISDGESIHPRNVSPSAARSQCASTGELTRRLPQRAPRRPKVLPVPRALLRMSVGKSSATKTVNTWLEMLAHVLAGTVAAHQIRVNVTCFSCQHSPAKRRTNITDGYSPIT